MSRYKATSSQTLIAHLITADIRWGVPRIQISIPKVQLKPLRATAKMDGITRTDHVAVRLRRHNTAVICYITNIATPYTLNPSVGASQAET
jgi:hypothetical protein